jgi:hypothetical protein
LRVAERARAAEEPPERIAGDAGDKDRGGQRPASWNVGVAGVPCVVAKLWSTMN